MDSDETDMGAMSSVFNKERKRNTGTVPVERADETHYKMTHKKRGYAVIFNQKRNTVTVPVERDETHYKMTHKKRGYALIFNHIFFDPRLKKGCRAPGTNEDAQRLQKTLGCLGFQVIIRNDERLTVKMVLSTLKELSRKNFSDCDCLMIVVLSHGEMNKIFAYDGLYPIDLLVENFTPDKCSSLAGKPKIFVLNLCRGEKRDVGVYIPIETDGDDENGNIVLPEHELLTPYRLPLYADFLYAYSTVPRFVSYRDSNGSWYVKTLCEVFDQYGTNTEITALLTIVNRRVAINFETADDDYPHLKQMPCFSSMLTRLLVFQPKK